MNPRLTLLSLFALSALPILAAQWTYLHLRGSGNVQPRTTGVLLASPAALPAGGWRLAAGAADCTAHGALLAAAERIARAQSLTALQAGNPPLSALPLGECQPGAQEGGAPGLTLVDPQGNAVLFYSAAQLADPLQRSAMLREIGQVVRRNPALQAGRHTATEARP